ncbi:MAG: serine protease [Trueperaceae bacterium]|nr:serine protease [Trueperaceae bacterium]
MIGDTDTREYSEWQGIFMTDPGAPDREPTLEYWARHVASDPSYDLAIIQIVEFADETPLPDGYSFVGMPVGDSNDLLPGDLITVVGYPGISGSTITFTAGLMSGWLGEDLVSGGKQWIKTDAKIAGGNSGGAAFNSRGELIGVPTAGLHLLEGDVYEEQLYVRPISLAWALIGPSVTNVYRAEGVPVQTSLPVAPNPPRASAGLPSGVLGGLEPGSSLANTIAPTSDGATYHTYIVDVPAGLASLDISLEGDGDIDLAVKAGSEILSYRPRDEGGDWDYLDFSPDPSPTYRYDNPPAGPIYIDVVNLLDTSLGYTLSASAAGLPVVTPSAPQPSGIIGTLRPGQAVSGNLQGSTEGVPFHTYVVEVPVGTPSLSILLDADTDLDLAAKYGAEIMTYRDQDEGGDWDYRDISVDTTTEMLVANPQPGRWYIDVFYALEDVSTNPYSLRVDIP